MMGLGCGKKPDCENTTKHYQRYKGKTADLPPRGMLDEAQKRDEPCCNDWRSHNPLDKLPLRVALDVVVLMPEPTPFLTVWIG